jgi:hypothetical protein
MANEIIDSGSEIISTEIKSGVTFQQALRKNLINQ